MNTSLPTTLNSKFAASVCAVTLAFLTAVTLVSSQSNHLKASGSTKSVKHLNDFQVIEFRRYTVRDGGRQQFAQYFDTYFPEAFEQLGALVVGQFFERKNLQGFTWIRAFHSMDDRAKINANFYYGPLWREHGNTLNSLMIDSDNVLLLRPLSAERGLSILPAVDPVTEPTGAQGVVVAEIFAIKPNAVDEFPRAAEPTFAGYRSAEIREAGVLVTLDLKNNFPQLPIREDGPYLVWLGIASGKEKIENAFMPLAERSRKSLLATNLLRAEPEIVILNPTPRSRLRWIGDNAQ